jgi:hypothetical protein
MLDGENRLCNLFKCPKFIFYDEKKVVCDKNNFKKDRCSEMSPKFLKFFELLDWSKLVKSLEVQNFLNLFKTILMSDDNIKRLLGICYGFNDYAEERLRNYLEFLKEKKDFTEYTLGQMPADFLAFDVKQLENNFCEDFIITCRLYYKSPRRDLNVAYNLFHISLHPDANKFQEKTLDNGKKIRACKTTNTFMENMPNRKNLFHYSINNIARPQRDNYEIINQNQPFKEFYFDNDALFLRNKPFFIMNNDNFTNLNMSLRDNLQVQQIYPRERLDNVNYDLLNELHNLIYNKFIEFWNNKMSEKFLNRVIIGGIKKMKKKTQRHRQNSKRKRKQKRKRTRRKY